MNEMVYLPLCSICTCFVTSYVLLDNLQWKTSGWKYFLVLLMNSTVIGLLGLYWYPFGKILVVIMDSILLGILLAHRKGKNLVEFISFGILIALCEFVTYPIGMYLEQTINNFMATNFQLSAILLAVSQIIILYLYRLYKYVRKEQSETLPMFVRVFQVIVLPIFTIINLLFMMMFSAYYMLPWLLGLMFLNMVFVISLNVYLFFLIDKMEENHQLRQKTLLLEEMSKMQYSYYHHLEEKYQSSRHVIHDVKRHLQVLETKELPKESLSSYIQDMRDMLSSYSQQVYSEHPIVNVILHEKFEEAQQHGIKVECQIAPIDFTFLREIDVTVIFANLLDNAIDACKDVEEKRELVLQIDQVHDFLVIVLRNTCREGVDTSKSTKQGHEGLGLQNVRATLEQYGGNMQVEVSHHDFIVKLYIPMV